MKVTNYVRPAALAAILLFNAAGRAPAQGPMMPASPLAGGAAAAAGGSFVDAHGNPIVMPANYCEPYAPYGACPTGPYGDDGNGAYADFGGWAMDQCGPYYFDIAAGAVFIRPDDLFQDVQPFGSIGLGMPSVLTPDEFYDDTEVGWHIAARYDFGPLSVLEGTYMGLYDIGFNETVFDPAASLTSIFSDYGVSPLAPIPGLDGSSFYALDYESDLQSTEFSYRRYWLGFNPRVSGTYILGARYIRMTEDLNFFAADANQVNTASFRWSDSNDMVGFQFGGDAWVCLRQGLRVGSETKVGIYNNRYEFEHARNLPQAANVVTSGTYSVKGDQVAFAGETSFDMVADILPSFSIRAGYRILYLNSLVTAGNNVFANELGADVGASPLLTQADAVYHGLHATIEYIW